MDLTNLSTHLTAAGFLLIGKNDPILQELWDIKSQINRNARYSVKERSRQLVGLTTETARLLARAL